MSLTPAIKQMALGLIVVVLSLWLGAVTIELLPAGWIAIAAFLTMVLGIVIGAVMFRFGVAAYQVENPDQFGVRRR